MHFKSTTGKKLTTFKNTTRTEYNWNSGPNKCNVYLLLVLVTNMYTNLDVNVFNFTSSYTKCCS